MKCIVITINTKPIFITINTNAAPQALETDHVTFFYLL